MSSVWSWATSAEGVNSELKPFFRMTLPAAFRSGDLDEVVLGERLGRSWILLLGVLPVDYDDITLVRLDPGRGFLERSRMLSQQTWEHERSLEQDGVGCVLTDRVAFVPRLRLPAAAFRPFSPRCSVIATGGCDDGSAGGSSVRAAPSQARTAGRCPRFRRRRLG